ncbi:single-stranded DNA-binding protein [Caldifermentibacillus hisashii]|uniref:single-stranded DNA-binding protein n=1 Tax=Caldifermentibacillus hisashii TaxID=996558 RepID=UPI0031FDA640
MTNRWVGVGRLTKDVELRFTPQGVAIANFTVAINRTFKNANGEYEADFINVVAFKKTAENVANYTKKGSMVAVDGRIQTRNYQNNEGKRVYVTEIVADSIQFLESKKQEDPFKNNGHPIDIDDSDLPF